MPGLDTGPVVRDTPDRLSHSPSLVPERGNGATLNGRTIRTSTIDKLKNSLLVTGFPYDVHTNTVNNIDNFTNFIKSAQAVRRLGSAAIDLCYVACGRFDGFWERLLSSGFSTVHKPT